MKKKLFAVVFCFALLASLLFANLSSAQSVLVSDSFLTIESESGYLLGIPQKCTGAQLKPNFSAVPSGLSDTDSIGTGLVLNVDGTRLTVVVLGDVNGDGQLTSTDYVQIKKTFANQLVLTGARFRAADINGDGVIRSTDYLRIKKSFAGISSIYEEMRITPGFNVQISVEGSGGTVTQSDKKLVVSPEPGYRLSSLKADGREIFVLNGELSLYDIMDTTVTAQFQRIQSVSAEQVTPAAITNTFYNDDATDYGVTWRSTGVGEPVLKYVKADGKTAAQADFSEAVEVTAYSCVAIDIYKNYAALCGLEPGTKYYYVVGDKSTETYSEVCSITTKEASPGKVTFFHMSDTQDEAYEGTYWNAALKSAYTRYPEGAFTIHTGDLVNVGGDESQWTKMLANTADYTRNHVLVPAAGNHEYWEALTLGYKGCTFAHFAIDLPNNQSIDNGIYYSFDYGNIHFVVLNTGDSEITGGRLLDSQLEWLKQDLAKTSKKWKIVALHNPLYSPGKYGTDAAHNQVALALRTQLNPIFAQYHVDLVLNGHDHVYSQSYPITGDGTAIRDSETRTVNDVEYLVNPVGTVHLESGVAGHQHRGTHASGREYSKNMMSTSPGNAYYSAITVEGNTLTVEFVGVTVNSEKTNPKRSWGIIKE